ncbi:MAG: DUF2071 domain-containing protein [Chloroflexi bacterium]|nr:DUF2071 domain-containing protein [Chloroflexota bacterium]
MNSGRRTKDKVARTFLTAGWANLVLLTFEVPEDLVQASIHPSLAPDLVDGRAHASLVAFDFQDTRLLGQRIPGYVNFPEINLRTYVRSGDRRGVSFVGELVPKRMIARLARALYNEPYRATVMRSKTEIDGDRVSVEHRWRWKGAQQRLAATGRDVRAAAPDGVERLFKEHEWGFGTGHSGALLSYRVQHPEWSTRQVTDVAWDVDFEQQYGKRWAFLGDARPISTIFAVGSEVMVSMPGSS